MWSNVSSVYFNGNGESEGDEVKLVNGPTWFFGSVSSQLSGSAGSGSTANTLLTFWDWDGEGANPPASAEICKVGMSAFVSAIVADVGGGYVRIDNDLWVSVVDEEASNAVDLIRATIFYSGGSAA